MTPGAKWGEEKDTRGPEWDLCIRFNEDHTNEDDCVGCRIIKAALSAAAQQGAEEALERAEEAVPWNWTDELLTGPDAAKTPLDCPGVEMLLRGVSKRIRALRTPAEEKKP